MVRPREDDEAQFVAYVVADVQQTWKEIFERAGRTYESTRLVLFDAPTRTGCGIGSPATGPFYCPADHKVYLDLGFFRELSQRFGAPGDFARAYVIAHEFGHHVQNVMGVNRDVRAEQQASPDRANECRSGWSCRRTASPASGATPPTRRASSSREISRRVSPRQLRWATPPAAPSHGADRPRVMDARASEQRVSWFRKGFDKGDPGACDTFSGGVCLALHGRRMSREPLGDRSIWDSRADFAGHSPSRSSWFGSRRHFGLTLTTSSR